MTRVILLISFLFFFGRFVYSSIGAWYHHQDKIQTQQSASPSKRPNADVRLNR
nr:YfgG family protein [Enterobacter cancerogenus]